MNAWLKTDWIKLTREEPVDLQRCIIDAHHHLWAAGEGLRGAAQYLSSDLLNDIAKHNVVGTIYVESGTGFRKDGPEVLRVVGETEFAAAQVQCAMATRAPILGIVASADLTLGPALQEVLDAHAAAGGGLFRGIRQLPNGAGRPPRQLLTEPAFREGAIRLGQNGYSLDAFAMYGQLPELAKLANAVPGTRFITNHLGVPIYRPAEDKREDVMTIWRKGMRELATCPNVLVKIGGIGMDRMFGTGWSRRDRPPGSDEVAAWWGDDIRFCIDLFGPSRCMFESNFPVDGESVGYTVLWNAFHKIALRYSDGEQNELFAGTARRAYQLFKETEDEI